MNTIRTRTRLASLVAGSAFAVAGVFGTPLAAMAADTHPSTTASTTSVVTVADHKTSVPSDKDLHPVAVTADQQTFTPTGEQLRNAKAIVDAGKALNLPPRAWEIAVATSLQETGLKNIGDLGDANDHDSLGLFQQRPSSGWGTPDQLTDPTYASTAFYKALVQVPGWDHMALTDAAQAVQVSAFGDRYAQWEKQAADLVQANSTK